MNTTETGKHIETMGTVQTNADRTVIGYRDTEMVDGPIVHYNPECSYVIPWVVESFRSPRYETNYRAGDVQRELIEMGFELLTRQDIRAMGEAHFCPTCMREVW